MGKLTVLNRPLTQHKLTIIRKEDTGTNEFRQIVGEIGGLVVYEVTRDLLLKNIKIEAPIGKSTQKELTGRELVIVPILHAGLEVVDGVLQIIPSAKVGHIGMYHDEEILKPHEYFFKTPPDIEERECIIVNPILATSGSTNMTIGALRKRGARGVRLAVLVAAPGGVKAVREANPDVDIYAAAEDEKLTDNGYVCLGLGDAGDRLFGIK